MVLHKSSFIPISISLCNFSAYVDYNDDIGHNIIKKSKVDKICENNNSKKAKKLKERNLIT